MNEIVNDNEEIHPDDELEEPIQDYNDDIFDSSEDDLDSNDHNKIQDNEFDLQNGIQKDVDILERDDFDDFKTNSNLPDRDENDFQYDLIPTTDTG